MRWAESTVLVTGGASFIGSHLVDALVARRARVRVVDDLSSGRLENIQGHLDGGRIAFVQADLADPRHARAAVEGTDVVFHLAADHGGRGYVDRHQVACATNFVLDGVVFRACREAAVGTIVYASSACVYPTPLQADPHGVVNLAEEMVGPPYDADNMYGWAKLMGEMTLRAYSAETGLRSACCRYFTVYGERAHENHAVMAMIARAFVRQRPFVVWGSGEQVRNWTHVSDIVAGTILAAETIEDGTAVNLGTSERTTVLEAAREVLRYTRHEAEIELHPDMPCGPLNRVADYALATKRLGWQPRVSFVDGLHRTIDWYFSSEDREVVASTLSTRLLER